MKASQLVCLLLIFMTLMMLTVSNLSRAQQSNQFCDSLELMVGEKENNWRQDVLGAFTNPLNERYAYLSTLLKQYKNSSASIRPFSLSKDIHGMVTKLAYLDSRINLIGWILFGPKEARSVLHSVRDIKSRIVNDPCCLKSTLELFERHCGALIEQRMKHSLANLCNYVVEKEAIREAIMLACGMESTKSHGIDVANMKVDITPAPIHGTFQYCGRVSVNSISRTKLQHSAKTYQVMVVPSKYIPKDRHNMIRICFHRNASMGLCQCEKDDWRYIQKGSWSSVMPLYEQRFIDVKFAFGISGYVTVSLEEVPPAQGWRYGLLVGGMALLFMLVSKCISFYYTGPMVVVVSAMRLLL